MLKTFPRRALSSRTIMRHFSVSGVKSTGNQDLREIPTLHKWISSALESRFKYTALTTIQKQAIPLGLNGNNLVVSSIAGSGKTLTYSIPILQHLLKSTPSSEINEAPKSVLRAAGQDEVRVIRPQALIVVPTRELGIQIRRHFDKMRIGKISTELLSGKMDPSEHNPCDILVSTPGRLENMVLDFSKALNTSPNLFKEKFKCKDLLDLRAVKILALDEADLLLGPIHLPQIKSILKLLPKSRQTILTSATIPAETMLEVARICKSFKIVDLNPHMAIPANIKQIVFQLPTRNHKLGALIQLLSTVSSSDENGMKAIVFAINNTVVKNINDELKKRGFRSVPLHSGMTHKSRVTGVHNFNISKADILVCTAGLLGRGVDLPKTTHVFNYDFPVTPQEYLHQVGRCGRLGKEGTAVSLVAKEPFVITVWSKCKALVEEVKWWNQTRKFVQTHGDVVLPEFEDLEIDYEKWKIVKPIVKEVNIEQIPLYEDVLKELAKPEKTKVRASK